MQILSLMAIFKPDTLLISDLRGPSSWSGIIEIKAFSGSWSLSVLEEVGPSDMGRRPFHFVSWITEDNLLVLLCLNGTVLQRIWTVA